LKPELKNKEKTECVCAWFGRAGWSANPNDKDLPFEYCKDCSRQKECRNKDIGNQEENAIESVYDRMYGQENEG
jgi:hypothetical protein